ncbi:MAG: outer membrane lipoprotein-sorting protein [Gammaproteobacteria bacterium]
MRAILRFGSLPPLLTLFIGGPVCAQPPLPDGSSVLEQAHQVVRALDLESVSYTPVKNNGAEDAPVLVNRSAGDRPWSNRFESHLRNVPGKGADLLVIYHSGTLRGTGVLVRRDDGPDARHRVNIWLPALRKTRRIATPTPSEGWHGSLFTYDEVMLGRPSDLEAQVTGTRKLGRCLGSMRIPEADRDRYTRHIPEESCDHHDKAVYELNSTPRRATWFDRQEALIGTQDGAPYVVRYFLNGELIKTVETDWQPISSDTPTLYPRFSYAYTPDRDRESLIYLPADGITLNEERPAAFWSELTLRRIRR